MRVQTFSSDLPLDALDARLRRHWPTFCGMSRHPDGTTVAHFTADQLPADYATVEAQLQTALQVQTDRAAVRVHEDAALITCTDPRIAQDTAILYVVDYNGQHGSSAEAPVVNGRVELEFVAPIDGLYRIRLQRISELHTGYVMIKAG